MSVFRGGLPCPTCKSPNTSSAGECLDCHAIWGDAFRCPFCDAHTRPVPHPLLVAACPACSSPRLGPSLDAAAYAPLLTKLGAYRRWNSRAIVGVPLAAVALALGAANLDRGALSGGRDAREAAHAEMLPVPHVAQLAEGLPEPATVFVLSLVVLGVLFLGVYAGVATRLHGRVVAEARRLAALGQAR